MLSDEFTILPAFEQNNVPVVIVASNLFAPYAGVFIQSLLDHASEENNYDIIIFQRDISKENKCLLKSLVIGYANVLVRFYDPSPLFAFFNFNYDRSVRFVPIEVLCKIIAPHILNYPGRIIAVDADTLLKTDISRLMDENLEGYSAGGVCDVIVNGTYLCDHISYSRGIKFRDYYRNVCGLDDLKNYVNSGLLLFDHDKYVQELEIKSMLDTVQQYIYPEQDALNVLMNGRIKALNFAWNVLVRTNTYIAKFVDAGSKLYGGACEQAYENPYLVHWAAKPKPWVCPDVPWGSEWWQTALRTPFVGHIIARMLDAQETRRAYFRKRYGKEIEVWDPSID